MPSSLTWVLPLVLGFSPRLPVSVCGTGTLSLLSSFSRQREFNSFPTYFQSPSRPRIVKRASLLNSLIAWTRSTSHALCLSFCVTASVKRIVVVQEYQPVVHRLRLLSSALAPTYPERTNLPQETLGFRRQRFSLCSRYSCRHSLSNTVHGLSQFRFSPYSLLPYRLLTQSQDFGVWFSPGTFSAHIHSTSELLRTL